MPTPTRLQLIAQLEGLPELLAARVERATDRQLDTHYRAGGWTVRQVVHHIADSHMNGFIRMRLVLSADRPALAPYNQDAWAMMADVGGPVAPSLAILRGLHVRWAGLLRALPEDRWTRTGVHREHGELTLDQLLAIYAEHGLKHVGHIDAGLAAASR